MNGLSASQVPSQVLLVEDEAKVSGFIAKGLREEGYTVDVAENATDGTRLLTAASSYKDGVGRFDYQLLILDWMLPDGDGLSLARQVRERGHDVPILMLTARDAVSERVEALDAGADDYLVKPFAFAEFLARVRALLRRSQGKLTQLRVGDIEIDLSARTVLRNGVSIPLTGKEFAVLSCLVRHPGRAVSRAEILQQVWAQSGESSVIANVVDVQVARLREKLEADGAPPIIHTVRRIGYSLGAR